MFANIKAAVRDKAHCAQRLTRKPWKADPKLRQVFSFYIRSKSSIAIFIFHSPSHKSVFASKVKLCLRSPLRSKRFRDLSSAPHRHASTQRPLGRICLLADCVVATAQEIMRRATCKGPKNRCAQFLQQICSEDLITLALLADSGDECMAVLRFYDRKHIAIAQAPAELDYFFNRIRILFLEEQVWTANGFSQYMVRFLRSHQLLVQLPNKEYKKIGGIDSVPEALKTTCIARLKAWVGLVGESLRAEFPSYDLCNSFACFSLQPLPNDEVVRRGLKRLAAVWKLDVQAMLRHRPFGQAVF